MFLINTLLFTFAVNQKYVKCSILKRHHILTHFTDVSIYHLHWINTMTSHEICEETSVQLRNDSTSRRLLSGPSPSSIFRWGRTRVNTRELKERKLCHLQTPSRLNTCLLMTGGMSFEVVIEITIWQIPLWLASRSVWRLQARVVSSVSWTSPAHVSNVVTRYFVKISSSLFNRKTCTTSYKFQEICADVA